MNMRELEAQAKFLAPVIASAVAKALEPMQKLLQAKDDQLAALTKRLDELPAPIEPDLEALAKAAADLIVVPEPIPGKNADEVDLEALAKAASELISVPVAPEVDLEALAKAAADLIVVPEPIPGKDAEPIDLEALAKAAADLIVVPEPIPGKNAEPLDLDA